MSGKKSSVPPDLERYRSRKINLRKLAPDVRPVAPPPAPINGLRDSDPAMVAHAVHAVHVILLETRDMIRDSLAPKLEQVSDRLGVVEDHQAANQVVVHQQLGMIDRRLVAFDGRFAALDRRLDLLDKRQLATEADVVRRIVRLERDHAALRREVATLSPRPPAQRRASGSGQK